MGMIAIAAKGRPQIPDSTYQKKVIPKTDIGIVFSFYDQDGDHSAVTGGMGTEKLQVYAPSVKMSHLSGKNTYIFDGGVDLISSASTDNIDHIVSSASKNDFRVFANTGYMRKLRDDNTELGVGAGFSLESDYLAFPVNASFDYRTRSRMQKVSAVFAASFDDLRWGRMNDGSGLRLVYPSELRYRQWYDIYRRQTYNLKIGFEQVISRRMQAAIFPEITYQRGLLATAFHRVYFTDSTLKVENLPNERWRFPVALKVNYFAGRQTILKGSYQFYGDNFGIGSHSFEAEAAVKVKPRLTIAPFARIYSQSGSEYFKPYREHLPSETFYTSDYDLSEFTSVKAGLGIRFAPYKFIAKRGMFREVGIRYTYYR